MMEKRNRDRDSMKWTALMLLDSLMETADLKTLNSPWTVWRINP